MKFKLMALTALMMAATSGFARDYQLVVDGKSDARIQMNPRPSAPEFRAAKELQDYVRKISGANIPRCTYPAARYRTGDSPAFVEVLLGTAENAKLLMPEPAWRKLSEAKSDEAFYIKTCGDRIFIVGKTPIGALYGAYTFIEKYLGVRWFHPGGDGEYCPVSKNIAVGEIDDFQEPSINGRHIGCWAQSVKPWTMEEVSVWQARNKIQFGSAHQYNDKTREELDFFACGNDVVSGGGHLTFEEAVPSKLFQAHPEYFPLRDGKRVCEERSQRCLANPDVQRMVVDHILAMTAYGARYQIGFHDSGFECFCHCPECVKMGTYDGKFTMSNAAHRFMGMVADQVLKRNPEAALSNYIYAVYRDLPTDPSFHYDKRLLGRYCPHQRCYVHRLDDPKSECNAKFFKELMAWRKICPKIGIFDYYAYSQSPYAPMEYTLAEDLKLYKKINLDYWVDDCSNKDLPIPSSNWPFYYVAAKMLWDASLDVDTLMAEAYGKYYGKAAEPMVKYQALRRELWEGAPGHAAYGGPKRIAYCLTVPGAEKRLVGYLDEAEKLAGGDPILKSRLAADRRFLNEFWVKEAEQVKKRMSGQNNVPVRNFACGIVIDGVLSEEDWRKAQQVTGFLAANGAEPVEETKVKVLYDKDNWYIGVEAMTEHAWSPLKATVKDHDGEVWGDDAVEVFLMPPDSDYYHWVINSLGTFYDAKARVADFESNAEIKAKVLKDRYVIEARIPAAPLGAKIVDGQTWQMHFYRSCKNLQPPNSSEGSSLDGTPPHEQTLFRRALVGASAITNGNFAALADKFPEAWGGSGAKLLPGKNNKNQIELKDCLYTYMSIPPSEHGNTINGEVVASGKGQLALWASTCVREPGAKRAFGHELKHEIGTYTLADKPAPLSFKFDLVPYEGGYLYLRVDGSAVVDSVNASRTQK